MRKPHAKSKLKTLAPERQREIFEYLGSHTLEETEAWLATAGIDTNRSSLSEFGQWYPVASVMHTAASLSETIKEVLRDTPQLKMSEAQMSEVGQPIFEAMAIKLNDPELFIGLRKLRQADRALELKAKGDTRKAEQKDRDLAISERRVKLLEQKVAEAQRALDDKTITAAEQAARIREIFKK